MQHELVSVLGIDAAWTDHQPSGVALLQRRGQKWKCVRVAPSYIGFCEGFAWPDRIVGAAVDVARLLAVCHQCLGAPRPVAVAVDMPLATTRIDGRRPADNLVSQKFGHCKCAAHSPTAERPGASGRRLQAGFFDFGYLLATTANAGTPALLEVYPHVALLALTKHGERVPYKVGKTNTYWPGQSAKQRKRRLIEKWQLILDRLETYIDDIDVPLPDPDAHSLEYLKRFEDAIDALVCAWTATQFLNKTAIPLGDDDGAIWIPSISMQFAMEAHAA
ncbi:MAG: DUF429 domain-containing protein [Betaproteobacteria bacterium]|nr:DUF429 domain-containing protein [Betaproteobacteria bacterium]